MPIDNVLVDASFLPFFSLVFFVFGTVSPSRIEFGLFSRVPQKHGLALQRPEFCHARCDKQSTFYPVSRQ